MTTSGNRFCVSLQDAFRVATGVVDTFATFDYRISYHTNPAVGVCNVTWHGDVTETICVCVSVTDHTRVHITLTGMGAADAHSTAYDGDFRVTAIHQQLGVHLATWYGRKVRR